MFLNLLFGGILLLGIILVVINNVKPVSNWLYHNDFEWTQVLGWVIIVLMSLVLIVHIPTHLCNVGNSINNYQSMIENKKIIEYALAQDENIDMIRESLMANVIIYNNKVIQYKNNSKRFCYSDYYSKDVDWDSLEFIVIPEQ